MFFLKGHFQESKALSTNLIEISDEIISIFLIWYNSKHLSVFLLAAKDKGILIKKEAKGIRQIIAALLWEKYS